MLSLSQPAKLLSSIFSNCASFAFVGAAVELDDLIDVWFSTRRIKSLGIENEELRKSDSESKASELEHKEEPFKVANLDGSPVDSPPTVTIMLRDGAGLVTIDANGNLRGLEALPEEHRQEIKKVLESVRVSLPPIIARLRSSRETKMTGNGDEPGFRLSSPVGAVVKTSRPTFRWTKFGDATHYEVSVSNARGEAFQRATVSGTDWRPAAPLARGRIYQWQVRAIIKDGREIKAPRVGQPDAKFSVLDQNKFNELERARTAHSSSHLVLGTMYAKAGLIDEARREFRALHDANPESQIARRILDSLTRR